MELRYVNSLFFRRFGSYAVTITAVSPANELGIVFAGTSNGGIIAWDLRYEPSPLARVVVYNAHKGAVQTLCWQPYYRLLFSGSVDGAMRIWDPSLTDFLDTSGTTADHSAFAQIFAREKDNPIIQRHLYTVQPLITEEESVSQVVSNIKLTRLVQTLGDFSRPITRIAHVSHHIVVLSLDGYITIYCPDPHRDLTLLKYPLFIRVARVFLGYKQLDRISNFSTLQLGYSIQKPIHRDSILEQYNFDINNYSYQKLATANRSRSQQSQQSNILEADAAFEVNAQGELVHLPTASINTREGNSTKESQREHVCAFSVTTRNGKVDANAPLDYQVNPLLTEPVMPTSMVVDADNSTFYVGDSNGTIHCLTVLDGKVSYKSRIKYVCNNAIVDCCFLPRESSIIATGADGTARGIITMTGKNYFARMSPRGTVFTRALHCPKRKLVEYEDLLASRPESAQLAKQMRGSRYMGSPSGASVSGIGGPITFSNTNLTQTLEEEQMEQMEQREKTLIKQDNTLDKSDPTAFFVDQPVQSTINTQSTYRYNTTTAFSIQVEDAIDPELKQRDDNVIFLNSSGLFQIVDIATNNTLLEATYAEIGPLPATLMAKATNSGVFLTTPVVTQPHRSLNHQLYAIAKMNLSLQEEYWILRGRFAKTMARMDKRIALENHIAGQQKKDIGQKPPDRSSLHAPARSQSRAKSKSSIESMDKKVSATKVDILNQYEDMRILSTFLLKLPPDLNPNAELIIGIVRPTCIDFLRPIYKPTNKNQGSGHLKPVNFISILPTPPLPALETLDTVSLGASTILKSKTANPNVSGQSQVPLTMTKINPVLNRSSISLMGNCPESKQEAQVAAEKQDTDKIPVTSVSAAALGYYQYHGDQEMSNMSESKNLDILSMLDDPISEEYAQTQAQQKREKYRTMSVQSRTGRRTNKDFVSAIINGDISISQGTSTGVSGTYNTKDIIQNQLASFSEISTRWSLSPYNSQARTTFLAGLRQSAVRNLAASRDKMSESADLTLNELQTSTKSDTTETVNNSQVGPLPHKMTESRFGNLILRKRVYDSHISKINKPDEQAKQVAPYLPAETDIVQHIVSQHSSKNGQLPLISRSGPRAMAQKKLAPPFFVISCSCDNDVYIWDARIMSRPYHHYPFSFDTLKYARILNLSQVTDIVLDAASMLFHKYLVDSAMLATKAASMSIKSSYSLDMLKGSQISKLLLSRRKSKDKEGSDSEEWMTEVKDTNRYTKIAGSSDSSTASNKAVIFSKMKEITDRVRREQMKKEFEMGQDEMFSRLYQGMSSTGKKFQSSTAQKGGAVTRFSNYTNYHVSDSDIRVRLLKLGKSGLLDKDAVTSLVKQIPSNTQLPQQTVKDMSFLDCDRFYILHPDVISMASAFLSDPVQGRDSELGISPNYAGKISKDSLYSIISRSDIVPPELVCDMDAVPAESSERAKALELAKQSGINLDTILSEEESQALNQFNQQVCFEIKKLSELPEASCFLTVEPHNFLMIGHEDGSLTAMVTTIRQTFRMTQKGDGSVAEGLYSNMVQQSGLLSESQQSETVVRGLGGRDSLRQTTIFRVLAGHSEKISCMCFVSTEQCCYVYSASIDGTLLCLIRPILGDFRLQYNSWSRFTFESDTKLQTKTNTANSEQQTTGALLSEAQMVPESIDFLKGTKAFLVAGTNLGNIYLITLPIQSQSSVRATLFFECVRFMQKYYQKEKADMQAVEKKAPGGSTKPFISTSSEKDPSFYIKSMDYFDDVLTLVLESGHVLQFSQVSLYYMHWTHFSSTGKMALGPSARAHYFSRITHGSSPGEIVLAEQSSTEIRDREAIPLPAVSSYFADYFSAFLPNFPFKLLPQRVFSVYVPTTRKPASADDLGEIRRREVTHESQENKIVASHVIFPHDPCLLEVCPTEGHCKYTSVQDINSTYDLTGQVGRSAVSITDKIFYKDGKVLERPVDKVLDHGLKYYDERIKEWKYIVEDNSAANDPPDNRETPQNRLPSILMSQVAGLTKTRCKTTTPMRYMNTSVKPVKISTSGQRSSSLGAQPQRTPIGKAVLQADTETKPLNQATAPATKDGDGVQCETALLSALDKRAVEHEKDRSNNGQSANSRRGIVPTALCLSYSSGLVRVYGPDDQVISELSYDAPACSFKTLEPSKIGEQILLPMDKEGRVTAVSTIWIGLTDGRILMQRCDALVEKLYV